MALEMGRFWIWSQRRRLKTNRQPNDRNGTRLISRHPFLVHRHLADYPRSLFAPLKTLFIESKENS